MLTGAERIEGLRSELEFEVVDDDTAMGEIREIPIAMSVLGIDPPAVMFRVRADTDGAESESVASAFEGLSAANVRVSLENDSAWLSFYDLRELDNAAIRSLLEKTADVLDASGLAAGPGCLRCGNLDRAQLMCVEGRPTRLCPDCLTEAVEEQQELEAEHNRSSLAATLGLPGAGLFVAAGWAGFWTLLDLALEHWRIQVVEINYLTMLLMFMGVAACGYALGWPAGVTLRQSIALGKAPVAASAVFVTAAAIGGEILYVGLYLLRLLGLFDLGVAAQLVGQVVAQYSGFWIFCKLALLAAIGFFCAESASERRTVRLQV